MVIGADTGGTQKCASLIFCPVIIYLPEFKFTELKDPLRNPGFGFWPEGISFIFQLPLITFPLLLFFDKTKDITACFEEPSGQEIEPVPPPCIIITGLESLPVDCC